MPHICRYCKFSRPDGKGCLHNVVSQRIGNRHPTKTEVISCDFFNQVTDKTADVTITFPNNYHIRYKSFNFKNLYHENK